MSDMNNYRDAALAQAELASRGATPPEGDLVVPGAAEFGDVMEAVQATPEYQSLVERRGKDEISREEYQEELQKLLEAAKTTK